MRLWSPELDAFRDHGQQLTRKLPDQPAAVPMYVRGRTRVLALDFDAKHVGREIVENDVQRCLGWIRECGGRTVVDHSTSGGQHVLVPLPIGTAVSRHEIEPVLRMLADRLPSLDLTPMLNTRTGCITPPGSRTREGGYRRLVGDLEDAVDALTVRSEPGFLARLHTLLGLRVPRAQSDPSPEDMTRPRTARATGSSASRTPRANTAEPSQLWEGSGDHARLCAHFRRTSPIPSAVRAFAANGVAPQGRWRAPDGRIDRSEARQAVLAAAVLRGLALSDVRAQLPAAGGDWTGFAAAYERYGRGADVALQRDWATACRWAAEHAPKFLLSAHKIKRRTGGWWGDPSRATKQAAWLASATMWVDSQWPGSSRRWTIVAVLQALAHTSVIAGTVVRGVPVVDVGGRSLSLAAGCLPETTVWQVLRDLRDCPGSPILRTRRAAGILPDSYALITPRAGERPIRADRVHLARVRVEPVHDAWSVLGLNARRLYELVEGGLTTPADVIAAAAMSRSAGYAALAMLTSTGLLIHRHGQIALGSASLDDIARAHGLPQRRAERIAQHRRQRAIWHTWLHTRFAPHTETVPPHSPQPATTPSHREGRRTDWADAKRRPTWHPNPPPVTAPIT